MRLFPILKRRFPCGLWLLFATITTFLFSPVVFAEDQKNAQAPPATGLDVEKLKSQITEEAPSELVSLKLGDADVSLQVSGFWKGSLQSSLGFSFNPLGSQLISPETPLLFSQEADLTLSLWVMDRWFLEANFLDNYALNTYRAGYEGLPGEFAQYVGVGNAGLDFPTFPYLDLGGDSPSSFGYYGRFASKNYTFHSLFRWDQAAREERVFVGGRERSYAYLSPGNTARGLSFVLPDENLDTEPIVFLEDEKGELRDNLGRRWRQAGHSEYAASRTSGLIELNLYPQGMVAVAYNKNGNRPWDDPTTGMGTYGNPLVPIPGAGFLGDAQDYFWLVAGEKLRLIDYPQCGEETLAAPAFPGERLPGSRVIGTTPALMLYEPGTFSPFERRSRYEAPSSASEEAALVTLSTSQRISGYELVPFERTVMNTDIPLYASSDVRRGFFELIKEGVGSFDNRSERSRWPLAAEYAGVYAPAAGDAVPVADISLRFTNYGSSGAYAIGTDVVPGSVQVWRNGLIDLRFNFNAQAGTVSLSSPAGFSEVIRIRYLKRSTETRLGSIAAGLGAVYHKEASPFTSELALGLRWNMNSRTGYTEEGASNPGTVGLSAKTAWDFSKFKAQVTAGLGFEQPDSSGLYRAAGMEGNEIRLSLQAVTAFPSWPLALQALPGLSLDASNQGDLTYRNYHNSGTLANPLMPITWNGARLVPNEHRPYLAKDSAFGTETSVLVAEFTLDNGYKWAGYEIPLYPDSGVLAGAKEIEIPFRFYDFNGIPPADFKLVLQIGSLSGKEFAFTENPSLVLEKILYDGSWNFALSSNQPPDNPAAFGLGARIARFTLSESDRLKLADAHYLRLVAVHTGAGKIQGRALLAPPIVRGASFRPMIVKGNDVDAPAVSGANGIVRAVEMREVGADSLENHKDYKSLISRLHPKNDQLAATTTGAQQVLSVSWEGMASEYSAGADGRMGTLPLSNYRTLSFFVKGPVAANIINANNFKKGTLSFVIAAGPNFLKRQSERYLEVEIPLSYFNSGKWSKVSVVYQGEGQGITVDGASVSNGYFRYSKQPEPLTDSPAGRAMYAAVYINSKAQKFLADNLPPGQALPDPMLPDELPDGSFCIDEILLEEPAPLYRLNGGARAEYKRPGTMLAIGKFPILADLSLSTDIESELRGDPFTPEREGGGGVASRSNVGISLLGANIKGNLAFTATEDSFNWNAGHEASRAFGPFSLKGNFAASPRDKAAEHRLNAAFSSAFRGVFNAQAMYDEERLNRGWTLSLGWAPPKKPGVKQSLAPSLSLDAQAAWASKNDLVDESKNYGELWLHTWRPMLPDLGAGADKRETSARMAISEKTVPLGATLSFDGKTAFTKINNSTRSSNTVLLELPITIKPYNFNIKMERGFKRYLNFSGADVRGEWQKFGESLSDALPLWGVFPLYSIFTPKLNDALDEGLSQSRSVNIAEYTWFNDKLNVVAQFPAFFDIKALFIPTSASMGFERILEQKLDTRSDVLHIRGGVGFSAVNLFGGFGSKPLFKFYQSDEFSHHVEGSFAIPKGEDMSWRLQWGIGAIFRGFTGGELNFNNTATVQSSGWLESLAINWIFPTKKSLLSALYDWTAKKARKQSSWLSLSKLMDRPYERLFKETLETAFDHSGDYLNFGFTLGHESIIRIVGQFYLTAFAKLNCTHQEQTETTSFVGTFGTTLQVFF